MSVFSNRKIKNQNQNQRQRILVALFLILFSIFSFLFFRFTSKPSDGLVKGRITEILSDDYFLTKGYSGDDVLTRETIFFAKILEGDKKGEVIKSYHTLDEMSQLSSYDLKAGDKVFLDLSQSEAGEEIGYFRDFVRDDFVFILVSIFALSLICFGKAQGIKTALSLGISCVFVFFFFIPLLLRGISPVFLSFLTSLLIVVLTLFLVIGKGEKAISAGVGTIGGLLCAFLLAFFMERLMHLTGLVSEESALLMVHSPGGYINLKGIVLSEVIIGALGAVMDVSVSVSSSLFEITEKNSKISPRELFKSGITIGRDIMGTMANTLILAYVGSSLQSILLIYTSSMGFRNAIGREAIAGEILKAICGSMGLLLAIPITALAISFFWSKKTKKGEGK